MTTLKITKVHATFNDYSCPLIATGGVIPCFAYQQEAVKSAHLVDPVNRSRGFPGHLPGSGRKLPKIDIEIRCIMQV